MPTSSLLGFENVWTISSPVGGTTVTANYALSTASGNCIVGLLNPAGNNKPLYVKRCLLTVVSGTAATNGFVYGVSPASQAGSITSTGATAARNNMYFIAVTNGAANGPVGRGFAGDTTASVLAGSTANTVQMFRTYGGGVGGALSAGQPYQIVDDLDGEIVVGPGCFLGLFAAQGGTTALVVLAALTWTEGP